MFVLIGTILTMVLIALFLAFRVGLVQPAHKGAGLGKPAFTIIFFLKNNENSIEWLVRRLMMLRYGNYETFEIILIDRGSRDKTLEIATKLQRDYAEVELVNGAGGIISAHAVMRTSSSRVVLMEEVPLYEETNQVVARIKSLLRKGTQLPWDQGPIKIETREEYNINRHNDTM